jgi:GntR family transcriptional regulator/MocR family aminotransferase
MGVASRPLSMYQIRRPVTSKGLLLGYGAVREEEIATNFARLAKAINTFV